MLALLSILNMAAMDSDDEGLISGSSQIRRNFQRVLSSSSEEETDERKHQRKKKRQKARSQQVMDSDGDDSFNISLYDSSKFEGKTQKKKMIFLEDSSDESVCDGISNAKRSKRIKEQRKLKLEEMAMKKNPKYRRSLDKIMSGTDSDDDADKSLDIFK